MNIDNYVERKKDGAIEMRAHGNGLVSAFEANYDQNTGKRLPDTVSQVNVAGLEQDKKNAEDALKKVQEAIANIDAALADVKKLDEEFSKETAPKAAKTEKQ